jgi:RHS repeat-associated protein
VDWGVHVLWAADLHPAAQPAELSQVHQQRTGAGIRKRLLRIGARYYASTMGRFLSPDLILQNILQIMNPQRWNKYAYALNSPLVLNDPTGKDATAVNFSGMVGPFGHEAIVSINSDGTAQFASFGPAQQTIGANGALMNPVECRHRLRFQRSNWAQTICRPMPP